MEPFMTITMAPINEIKITNAFYFLRAYFKNINSSIAINGTLKFIKIDELMADVKFKAYT